MFDLFNVLIDRLIQLADKRNERKSELFTRGVEDVYELLTKIHESYLTSCRTIKEKLDDSRCSLADVATWIHQERFLREPPLRRLVESIRMMTDDSTSDEVRQFYSSIADYLKLSRTFHERGREMDEYELARMIQTSFLDLATDLEELESLPPAIALLAQGDDTWESMAASGHLPNASWLNDYLATKDRRSIAQGILRKAQHKLTVGYADITELYYRLRAAS